MALVVAGVLVAPAFGASEQVRKQQPAAAPVSSLASFTPASADPRLAAMFARGGLDVSNLRFTPAATRRDSRAVTVAVRARTITGRSGDTGHMVAAPSETAVALTPVAYNLGVGVGWRRVSIAGDAARVDMAGLPGGREAADVSVAYSGARLSGRVKAAADRPYAAAVPLIDSVRSYSLDVAGSYKLTRNLDVTAGLRYRSDRERLAQFDEDRRDSQAVYLGTAFRF